MDLPATFLALAGQPVPGRMSGLDQSAVWLGQAERRRDHVTVENHHPPTTGQLRTDVNGRYKLTVYLNQPYGELFDLQNDPGEFENLWDSAAHRELRAELTTKLLFAEMAKEPIWMPCIFAA